ncbi:MAG: aminoacyl-tRNA hydrolase [Candidatus Gracilibacteria bacterium]
MKIICGLGNPGKEYENTRHNVGFLVLDAFAEKMEFPPFERNGKSLVSVKGTGKNKVMLVKPQTFMNLSGEAVAELLNFYKVEPKDLIVIYDDVDLPLGTIRYREKGSAGTHNGMRSIVETLATLDFPRLRIGTESRGVTAPAQMDLHDFVLAPFLEDELPVLKGVIEEALAKIEEFLV